MLTKFGGRLGNLQLQQEELAQRQESNSLYRMFEPNCHVLWENSGELIFEIISDNYKVRTYIITYSI